MTTALPRSHPASLLATWFGAGLLPKAPGTWGSLAALPFAWGLWQVGGALALGIATIVVSLVGWWAAARFVQATGIRDPSVVVVDEVAGQWLTLLAATPAEPWTYLAGFLLFRLFDIKKPGPIGWLDRHVEGGLGVMADDILAGLFALICLGLVRWVL